MSKTVDPWVNTTTPELPYQCRQYFGVSPNMTRCAEAFATTKERNAHEQSHPRQPTPTETRKAPSKPPPGSLRKQAKFSEASKDGTCPNCGGTNFKAKRPIGRTVAAGRIGWRGCAGREAVTGPLRHQRHDLPSPVVATNHQSDARPRASGSRPSWYVLRLCLSGVAHHSHDHRQSDSPYAREAATSRRWSRPVGLYATVRPA
jgi:hypothetical protein